MDESFPMAHLNPGLALMEKTLQDTNDFERAEKALRVGARIGTDFRYRYISKEIYRYPYLVSPRVGSFREDKLFY